MQILVWLLRAAVFFGLFAFALNNQQIAHVNWFFGFESRAPMVFIVLAAFGLGCALGVFAMVPAWWRHRRVIKQQRKAAVSEVGANVPQAPAAAPSDSISANQRPPLDGI
jgi:lipopolysaccharide assembly protein A